MSLNSQVNINLISNFINLLSSIFVGICYTPYLLNVLGPFAYGVVPLALVFNQYINVITSSLTNSLTRFYSISLQKGEKNEASKYLSTTVGVVFSVILSLAPILFYFITHIDSFINIKLIYLHQAKILFSFTIFSLFISLYSSILNVSLFAQNRLDLLNITRIIRTSFRLILVVVFFSIIKPNYSIEYVGYANFLTEFIVLITSYYFFRKKTANEIKIKLRSFDKRILVSISGLTFWNIIHQIGDTGLYRIDSFLVSSFWDTALSGILSALSEIGIYVMAVTSVVSSVFAPIIMIAYSKNMQNKVISLSLNSSLMVGLLTAIITGILIGHAIPIISLWIGSSYNSYSNWLILKLLPIPFYISSGIYSFVYRAWNKVMFPAIVTIIFGVINFSISYILFEKNSNSTNIITYVIGINSFIIFLQSYLLNASVFCSIYKGNVKKTGLICFKILLVSFFSSFISFEMCNYIKIESVFMLTMNFSICFIICLFVVYRIVLNPKERNEMCNLFIKHE
jgi:O-antigen/teichoic acid export membrane protein